MPKFFVDEKDILSDKIILMGENMHHLVNVLRASLKDEVTVSDGTGFDYLCSVEAINKASVELLILDKFGSEAEPQVKISLFQGLPKGDKMSLIVEKCVEAGVFDITPVDMARCVSKLSKKDFEKKKPRFEKISMSAAKQSGRGIVPEINGLIGFDEFLNILDNYDLVLFPYEEAKDVTVKSKVRGFSGKTIAIIIGPEGGFSKEEAEKLNKKGVCPVTLGNRILRTETAGMAAIFNILYELEL